MLMLTERSGNYRLAENISFVYQDLMKDRNDTKDMTFMLYLNSQTRLLQKSLLCDITDNTKHKKLIHHVMDKDVREILLITHKANNDIQPTAHELVATRQLVETAYLEGVSIIDHVLLNENKQYISLMMEFQNIIQGGISCDSERKRRVIHETLR